MKVIDWKKQKLLSFYEIAEEKQKNGTVTQEESAKFLRLCCMGSAPSQQIIASGEKKFLNVVLNDIYEFKPGSVYSVELKRIEWMLDGKKRIFITLPVLEIRIENEN